MAQGTPGAIAAKQATATIPIVMPVVADPVATGLVASLVRPGGNVTGLTWFSHEVSAKRMGMLRDAVPRAKRVAVLINPDNSSNAPILQAIELAARQLKLEIQSFEARGANELESAFAAMAARRVDAKAIANLATIDPCITNRHHGQKKAGNSEAVIKDRRSAGRFRAFFVIRHSAAMSSSRLSGRPLASVALKWVQTNSSGFRSGA